jgi:hypothetical protein
MTIAPVGMWLIRFSATGDAQMGRAGRDLPLRNDPPFAVSVDYRGSVIDFCAAGLFGRHVCRHVLRYRLDGA